jgi:hypothetical protein
MRDLTLREVLQCAQPLFFEDAGEELIYSCGGTFFFVRFRNNYYAVTANHCLYRRDFGTLRFVRPDASKERAFFSPEVVSVIETPLRDSTDLAFIRLNEAVLSPQDKSASWFLDIDTLRHFPATFGIGDGLGMRGCPKYAGGIDYDNWKIQLGFTALSGTYAGVGHEPNMHKFKFDSLHGVSDLDGVSGSPVLKIVQTKDIQRYWFAGVVLQGTVQSGLARFVDYRVVFQALEILANRH